MTIKALKTLFFVCLPLVTASGNTLFAQRADLKAIQSWGYQLQELSVFSVRKSSCDLVVIDPWIDGDPPRLLQEIQLGFMKNAEDPDRKKIILAYLSIGEAEDYRPYWKKSWERDPPLWLGKENPAWKGNFKVRYWYPAWQRTILGKSLEDILRIGFDGVYLDIVDGYEYWADEDIFKNNLEKRQSGDPYGNKRRSADLMIDWIAKIAKYARIDSKNARPDFLVLPQNGEGVLLCASRKHTEQYWNTIDGIGVESLFYFGEASENNPLNIEQERLEILRRFPARNKLVLAIDYLTDKKLIEAFFQRARRHGFVPYTSVRELDRLMDVAY